MRICSVEGCEKNHVANSFCYNHWHRWKNHGNPFSGGVSRHELSSWVLDHLNYDRDECLIWPYGRTGAGYGSIGIDKKTEGVHVVIATILYGARPTPYHDVRHICGKGALGCVNPKHLAWGTKKENSFDCIRHGTICRGERNKFSKLSENQVLEIIDQYRDGKTNRYLSTKYSVSHSTIWRITSGRKWSWLTTSLGNRMCVDGAISHKAT